MVLRISIIVLIVLSGCSDSDAVNGTGESEELSGKDLFEQHCAICHGSDGKLCLSGAPDLSETKMDSLKISEIVTNGQNGMPGFGPIMPSDNSIGGIVEHVKSLRK